MKKKMTKATCRKRTSLLAAAALSAALLGGQVYPAFAGDTYTAIEASTLIPENVTIEEPTALSNVSLPKSEYGTLSWADDSYVPTSRVQSCAVVFKPSAAVDLSNVKGWDSESGVISGSVTVVVSSIQEEAYEEESYEEENYEESSTQVDGESEGDENPADSEKAEDASDAQQTITPDISEAQESDQTGGAAPEEAGDTGSETEDEAAGEKNPDAAEEPEKAEADSPEAAPAETEAENTEEVNENGQGSIEEGEVPADSDMPAEEKTEVSVSGNGADEEAEDVQEPAENEEPETEVNIFDRTEEAEGSQDRPVTAETGLTEEEMAAQAEINHSCDGIYVSGITLPWYVQFRATGGDDYEFTNESDAAIFKSYEFELWDLQNNTEYKIPDGEYISVTVPVKEGYDYSIEHLLDNGAVETIIPSVDGGTMIFSTHSFSPFGIAGSKTIVGSDIAEDGYQGEDSQSNGTTDPEATQIPVETSPSASSQTSGSSSGQVTSTPSPTKAPAAGTTDKNTNNSTAQNANSGNTVNTGDNTMILPFVILVIAAVIIIVVVVVVRRKK